MAHIMCYNMCYILPIVLYMCNIGDNNFVLPYIYSFLVYLYQMRSAKVNLISVGFEGMFFKVAVFIDHAHF